MSWLSEILYLNELSTFLNSVNPLMAVFKFKVLLNEKDWC